MNKRFFVFVFSMTIFFFFINHYYTSKKQKEYQEYQKHQEQISQKNKLERDQNILERTASIKDLPIVRMYKEGESVSWGVRTEKDSYLTLSWGSTWPNTLVAEGKQVTLIQADNNFALYSSASHPGIASIYVPKSGVYDLQVVTFVNSNEIEVTLAELDNGQLFFPATLPKNSSIVLYKYEHLYLPIGVYTSDNQSFVPFSKLNQFEEFTEYRVETSPSQAIDNQKFYVLENESMQVVFSNIGGAIAEINLPFKSKTHANSVVLPINFDRIINKDYVNNSLFPLNPYYAFDTGTGKMLFMQPFQGGYYPLLRRGIKSNSGELLVKVPPKHYAFNTISEDLTSMQVAYNLVHFDDRMIQFEMSSSSRRIIKTYYFPEKDAEAPYCLLASIKIEGNAKGLWVSSGIPEVELISGKVSPAIKYSTFQNNRLVVDKLSLPKTSITMSSFQPEWVSNSNGYFTVIIDPQSEIGHGFQAHHIPGAQDPSRIVIINSESNLYPSDKYPGYEVCLPLKRSLEPLTFRLYVGPLDQKTLKQVDMTFSNPHTGHTSKYVDTQSFHGWFAFISEPFAKFLYFIMRFFYILTGSWGISIILLTFVLRIMMYPLNAWSIKSTLKLQKISPVLKKLQDKYKNDPKKGQMEIMAFYKENKVNPFSGCLPLIIQMPFLFGMFDLLQSTFSLRGVSFIPGWIDNLTAPDVLFSWSYSLPFFGTQFHLLPVLLGVVMFFQQRAISAQSKKMGSLTDQQKQQQKMGMIMTIAFTFLFYKFPSGLNIYWLSSMGLQILQQWYTSKRQKMMMKHKQEIIVNPKKK